MTHEAAEALLAGPLAEAGERLTQEVARAGYIAAGTYTMKLRAALRWALDEIEREREACEGICREESEVAQTWQEQKTALSCAARIRARAKR